MKNYQRLYYRHFYAQKPDGEYVPISRGECFAPATSPTAEDPYKQRWYYDPEAGYAVRLPRTQRGDEIGKRNAADLKAEERHQVRKFQCIWRGTDRCDQDCARCSRQHTSRTIELDKNWNNDPDGDMETRFDIADEAADIAACYEDEQRLAALISALDDLTEEDRKILQASYGHGKTVREIADELGFRSHTSIVKRLAKVVVALRASEQLKGYSD